MVVGAPTNWADLIDPMVPQILELVLASWDEMPSPASDEQEDKITEKLCHILKGNRTARDLPFQIQTQYVELEPGNGEGLGRLDIVFIPPINREDIYFCLECKRLNVTKDKKFRTYASEYVKKGMLRFVTGQYSQAVKHGGMAGYVLDGNIASAIKNVEKNIKKNQAGLCMSTGNFPSSSVLSSNPRAKETKHKRAHEPLLFSIHHLFVGTVKSAPKM